MSKKELKGNTSFGEQNMAKPSHISNFRDFVMIVFFVIVIYFTVLSLKYFIRVYHRKSREFIFEPCEPCV